MNQARQFTLYEGHEPYPQLRAAIGDAAMTVHFFSFTGVNTGFKSAAIMGDLIDHVYNERTSVTDESKSYLLKVQKQMYDWLEQSGHYSVEGPKRIRSFPNIAKVNRKLKQEIINVYSSLTPASSSRSIIDPGRSFKTRVSRASAMYNWIAESLLVNHHLLTSYDVMHGYEYGQTSAEANRMTYSSLGVTNHAAISSFARESEWKVCPWDVGSQLAHRWIMGGLPVAGIEANVRWQHNFVNWDTDVAARANFGTDKCQHTGLAVIDDVNGISSNLGSLLKTDPSLPLTTKMEGLWLATVDFRRKGDSQGTRVNTKFIYDIKKMQCTGTGSGEKCKFQDSKVYRQVLHGEGELRGVQSYWRLVDGEFTPSSGKFHWDEEDERGAKTECKYGEFDKDNHQWTCKSTKWYDRGRGGMLFNEEPETSIVINAKRYEFTEDRDTLCALYEAMDDEYMHRACTTA